MKHKVINILAALAVVCGLVASVFAPWWVVWFISFPVMYAGAITLLSRNTDYIQKY